jgi:hypothetical protein
METHSATTVQRLYRNMYRKVPPTRKNVYAWRKQIEVTGCLCKGKSPERPRVADDTVEAIRRSYMLSPSKSRNRASRESGIPLPTVWKILCKRLKMRPYKIQRLQALQECDKKKRVRFCTDFKARVDEDEAFIVTCCLQ